MSKKNCCCFFAFCMYIILCVYPGCQRWNQIILSIVRNSTVCAVQSSTRLARIARLPMTFLCACLHLLETSLRWHSTEKISRNTKFKICISNFKFLLFRNCITIATINISQKKRAFEIAVIWNAALAVYMEDLDLCILIDFCTVYS